MQHNEDACMRSIQLVQIHQCMLSDNSLIPKPSLPPVFDHCNQELTCKPLVYIIKYSEANESGHEGNEGT